MCVALYYLGKLPAVRGIFRLDCPYTASYTVLPILWLYLGFATQKGKQLQGFSWLCGDCSFLTCLIDGLARNDARFRKCSWINRCANEHIYKKQLSLIKPDISETLCFKRSALLKLHTFYYTNGCEKKTSRLLLTFSLLVWNMYVRACVSACVRACVSPLHISLIRKPPGTRHDHK